MEQPAAFPINGLPPSPFPYPVMPSPLPATPPQPAEEIEADVQAATTAGPPSPAREVSTDAVSHPASAPLSDVAHADHDDDPGSPTASEAEEPTPPRNSPLRGSVDVPPLDLNALNKPRKERAKSKVRFNAANVNSQAAEANGASASADVAEAGTAAAAASGGGGETAAADEQSTSSEPQVPPIKVLKTALSNRDNALGVGRLTNSKRTVSWADFNAGALHTVKEYHPDAMPSSPSDASWEEGDGHGPTGCACTIC